MLEVLPGPEHVVAMRVSGRVETEDVERSIAAVEEALIRQDRIALYAEITMSGMTPGAFARDLGYGLRHLDELRRFARMAVVTDQEWVRQIVRAEGYILPQIEIRTFAESERDEALVWVAQPIPSVEPEGATASPSVHLIETTKPDVIAFEVKGGIRRHDMHQLVTVLSRLWMPTSGCVSSCGWWTSTASLWRPCARRGWLLSRCAAGAKSSATPGPSIGLVFPWAFFRSARLMQHL